MSWLRVVIFAIPLVGGGTGALAATLELAAGGEVTLLEITHCRVDSHRSGQLAVEAEITAVGSFGGRSAMLLLAKVSGSDSDHLDLYLIEPTEELRTMPPLSVVNKITMDQAALHGRRFAELNAEYSPEALAKLPPDEMMARVDEQTARIEALEKEMEALQPPHARSFGVATVEGSTIRFAGSDTRILEGEQEEAFADLTGDVRLTARCEK